MKLEVGMYYRTKIGKIGFIEDKLKLMCLQDELKQKYVKQEIDNITKASFNIIDLIEVGDLIQDSFGNLLKVNEIFDKHIRYEVDNSLIGEKSIFCGYIKVEDIKLILTHELYEANCYKVGE